MTISSSSIGPTFLTAISNMGSSFPAIFTFVNAIIALIGLILFVHAWWALNQHYKGNGQGLAPGAAVTRMLIGGLLTCSVYFIVLTKNTLIGSSVSSSSMLYQTAGLTAIQQATLKGLFGLFQVLGLIAFAKGWLIIDSHVTSNKQGSGWGGGITFIIAGTCAVFLQEVLGLVADITGINLVNILLF